MQDNFKEININGTLYKTELTKKFEGRTNWEAPNPKKMSSFIPGTIVEIFIKEGQEVKAGEKLLILEAMKMKNLIAMPFDGKIKKVYVQEGEKVPNRHLMIEIE
ncbi:MAG: biotin/lipoyl-containing protein [Marinifilaceae bacterium]|jgi:biotin carboxyl carrier protein